tara:strand:- start:618 stop:905 length:288 start_codon:yes stop_codon:yes gene_type:complete
MKGKNYEIPENKAVCMDDDCTCKYVYTTEEENVIISHCRNREIGSHLWLDLEIPRWSSLAPIDMVTHNNAVLQGKKLIKKLNMKELFSNENEPLH